MCHKSRAQTPAAAHRVSIDHRVVELTEPTTSGESLEVADWDLVKLASPGLRAMRVIVRLEGGTVVYHRTSVRVRTRTTMSPGLVGYRTCGPRGKGSSVNGVPLTQLNTYVPNDPFPAASHERALDKLTMEVQQLDEAIDRATAIACHGWTASAPAAISSLTISSP